MKARQWTLLGLLIALGLTYVFCFTEWLRPAPILIASQVRFSLQPKPRFGRPERKVTVSNKSVQGTGEVRVVKMITTNPPPPAPRFERVSRPESGILDQTPGGAANVTFSLDDWYRLTRIRVQDVPADGSAPKIVWQVVGQSLPLNSLLYSRCPSGMKSVPDGAVAEKLIPGAPYLLVVEAGRRRGTNRFTTVPLQPQE